MTEVILHSDNVGIIFVSRKLGKSEMLAYIRKFGFGQLTGIDLQEESSPILRPDDQWQDVDWATAAFGQGIAVTRIQMLTAVNAIANGGKLIPPRVVTGIESEGKIKKLSPPSSISVISPEAASAMTRMMINGVEKGEVRYYQVPGYIVAGKTGTAQVPISGHYDKEKVIASFIGFAPADNPKFSMLVTLREPQTSPWGSTTAAPLWFGIAESLFRYFHLPPKSRG
jgi:cell division protein FtsI/penicillin-binding protein 2